MPWTKNDPKSIDKKKKAGANEGDSNGAETLSRLKGPAGAEYKKFLREFKIRCQINQTKGKAPGS